jgi:hypothetical protein
MEIRPKFCGTITIVPYKQENYDKIKFNRTLSLRA